LPLILEDATNELTAFSRRLFASLYNELLSLEEKIQAIDEQIWTIYQASEPCQRIAAVEGIGPLTATALVDGMSEGKTFKNGRQFAAWLGLSKRGDPCEDGAPTIRAVERMLGILLGANKDARKYA
jgi:transposase